MELATEQIHILMVSFTAQGHINPMLRLAKRLQSKGGIHVSLATTELARERMLKYSTTITTTEENNSPTALSIFGINILFFSDGMSLDYDRRADMETYMNTMAEFGPINLSNTIKDLYQKGSPKFSHMIINPFVPWATNVAEELEIPCSLLWIQPCSVFSIYYHFLNKLADFPTSDNPETSVQLPGLPFLSSTDLPSLVLPSNPFPSITKCLVEIFKSMNYFKYVFANSFYELEKDAIPSHVPIKPVGPLIPSTLLGQDKCLDVGIDMWKSDDACLQWLDQRPENSVLYVAFGSLAVLTKPQMQNIATALRNCANMGFIWVVKPPDFPSPDGSGVVPEGFAEETKERGMVVPWCNQGLVLSHRSVACFLSHCGWNSLLEAVSAGVPVIGFPQWSDQPTNARMLSDVWGVGVRVCPGEDGVVGSEQIEKCVQEVVSGSRAAKYRAKAMNWKRAARDAVADGGSSEKVIEVFIDDVVRSSKSMCLN
ncbi:hypothetical protein Droror1_Dr00007456 [Drosera rotundifolia]